MGHVDLPHVAARYDKRLAIAIDRQRRVCRLDHPAFELFAVLLPNEKPVRRF